MKELVAAASLLSVALRDPGPRSITCQRYASSAALVQERHAVTSAGAHIHFQPPYSRPLTVHAINFKSESELHSVIVGGGVCLFQRAYIEPCRQRKWCRISRRRRRKKVGKSLYTPNYNFFYFGARTVNPTGIRSICNNAGPGETQQDSQADSGAAIETCAAGSSGRGKLPVPFSNLSTLDNPRAWDIQALISARVDSRFL